MFRFSAYLPFVVAMALVVVASNVLVQFPVGGSVGNLALADAPARELSAAIRRIKKKFSKDQLEKVHLPTPEEPATL